MWDLWVYPEKVPVTRCRPPFPWPLAHSAPAAILSLKTLGPALTASETSLTSWWTKLATHCSRIQRCTMIDESMMIIMIYDDLWRSMEKTIESMMIYDDLWRSMMIYEDLWKNTDAMSSELARELAIAHSICFIKRPSSPTGWARLLDRTDLCSVNRVIFLTQRTVRPCQNLGRLVSSILVPSGYLTISHGKSPFLSSVNHL